MKKKITFGLSIIILISMFGILFYLNKINESDKNTSSPITTDVRENYDIINETSLNDIVRNNNMVNIYFFYGDGCKVCTEELEMLKSLNKQYGEYYNLYTFETWYNENNIDILNSFASNMGDQVLGVPYTIIGNQSFIGFNEQSQEKFINAIEKQYKNSYDIYFDKIK